MLNFAYDLAQETSFFSHLHPSFFEIYLFLLGLSSLRLESHSSASGFYIVPDQLLPYTSCNLSSAETHRSIYGALQFSPVYTFLPYQGLCCFKLGTRHTAGYC